MNDKKIEKLIETGKTDEEIVKIMSEEDLSEYGIKKLEGGTIKDLKKKYLWIIDADIDNAEIDISGDELVWKDGYWFDGTWKGGTWKDGSWLYGTWKDGVWEMGYWKEGIWEGGYWKDGLWEDGYWEKGTWKNGEWEGGTWENGIWETGQDEEGNIKEDSPDNW